MFEKRTESREDVAAKFGLDERQLSLAIDTGHESRGGVTFVTCGDQMKVLGEMRRE